MPAAFAFTFAAATLCLPPRTRARASLVSHVPLRAPRSSRARALLLARPPPALWGARGLPHHGGAGGARHGSLEGVRHGSSGGTRHGSAAAAAARTMRAVASDDAAAPPPPPRGLEHVWAAYVRVSTVVTNLFPVWTLLAALSALKKPAMYTWLTTPYFTLSLGVLMLSMGITLSVEDFRRVLRRFGAVTIGFMGCYLVMPLLALALAKAFNLPPDLAAGTILVGAVNGGQASNLCTYIANGNVALSVMMTTATTLGAIVMTPLISKLLIGAVVPVNAVGIAWSTIQVVLLPIALGMFLNRYANRLVRAVLPVTPVLGVAATCLLVGSSVAQCATPIMAAGWNLQIPIMLLHLLGGVLGYFMVAAAGYGEIVRRTTAIETSMKSSAFGFLLASLHFGRYMVRVPSAVSVVWMALVGSTMAVFWRYVPVKDNIKFDRSLAQKGGGGSQKALKRGDGEGLSAEDLS